MKKNCIGLLSLLFITISFIILNKTSAQPYKKIHNDAIVIDGHNHIIDAADDSSWSFDQNLIGKTQTDLARMQQAGIDVQVFSIWGDGEKPGAFGNAIRRIDTLYAWINRNPHKMMIVRNDQDLFRAVKEKELGAIIALEGGRMMEDDLSKLDSFFKKGVRRMTLTWDNNTSWATSAKYEIGDSLLQQPKGLNAFGKQVVKRMNQLGMIIDLSHAGEKTFYDAVNTSTKPVIASHSCVYNLCPSSMNLKDEQIKAIAKNHGVVMLCFLPDELDSNLAIRNAEFDRQHKEEEDSIMKINPAIIEQYLVSKYKNELEAIDRIPISLLIDHIDYIVKLVGVDYVGLGSSFDATTDLWQGLNGNGVLDYPEITKALLQKGYTKKDIEKILGGNFIRVFKANIQ